MAMDTEEMIRAQPMDAVVLVGGCDKTLPAQVMAAASVDLPAVVCVPTGPMAWWAIWEGNEVLGACTGCRAACGHGTRAGAIDVTEIELISTAASLASVGTCMVMGTASTMACIVKGPGHGAAHERDSTGNPRRPPPRCREASGRRAAEMAISGAPKPSELITESSVRNAMIVLQAIGGSTNGLIHLTAIAGHGQEFLSI